ncbi:alkane 1-monooxygenase [Pontivivens insulae]|uniref:Alkane 1-monooxygenase 2 n=1 Tax=Pontivivens insulae TaxID=1639689 RepID=A0A2R8A8F5_9RHOB|nr:alkane 1-monooxygenase [Pontivivens insulae]RED18604.1 alkane 1-monooxygenase [Pontivivens insulae]SPF28502.1 Alkane 1-monooxygenase 2 [Pontivivens insulae]
MPAPALPFWMSLSLVPLILLAALNGGWWLAAVTTYTIVVITFLDAVLSHDTSNADPMTQDRHLFWHKLVTWVWPPMQFVIVFGAIWWAVNGTLERWEAIALFAVIGVATGAIGINFSHELIHQRNRWEPRLGEFLLTMVCYGHFRSEHVLVHHRYVATPRDPVTARYNESFFTFFPRVLWQQVVSGFRAEAALLARKGKGAWDASNPYWRYIIATALFAALAYLIGGLFGLGLFALQAFVAVLYLELTNYIEHYGLTRRHLGDGKYEHVKPHHSWNANHRVSNWFLINLQRHSDHHYKPDRRFPLLQAYDETDAPQLPFGYPVMTVLALNPLLFRRVMNKRVKAWRRRFYPDITDWSDYKAGTNPQPR